MNDFAFFMLQRTVEEEGIDAIQAAVRAVVIYGFTLGIVRLGSTRVMGKASAFDDVVAIMLGSVMSRGIDSTNPMLPTLAAGVTLIGVHWVLALAAIHIDRLGAIVKGGRVLLVKNGEMQRGAMTRSGITQNDLEQAIRAESAHRNVSSIERAYLERSGDISVIAAEEEPRVVEVSVERGVQKVRIQLG